METKRINFAEILLLFYYVAADRNRTGTEVALREILSLLRIFNQFIEDDLEMNMHWWASTKALEKQL